VRESERDRYTYIILSTSRSRHDEVLAGLEAGADDYLVKPLDPWALQTRLLVAQRLTALHAELAAYRAELARSARTDALTGLPNRRQLAEDLDRIHTRSERYERPYSVALCDIDHFKRYNDTHGHLAGDRALQAVATTLGEALRSAATVYR
jgi:PleD family two-component response regulator